MKSLFSMNLHNLYPRHSTSVIMLAVKSLNVPDDVKSSLQSKELLLTYSVSCQKHRPHGDAEGNQRLHKISRSEPAKRKSLLIMCCAVGNENRSYISLKQV